MGLSRGVLNALPSCLELRSDGSARVLTNWNPAGTTTSNFFDTNGGFDAAAGAATASKEPNTG